MRKLLLSVAALALGGLAWALEDDIAQWIKDLGSPEQKTREAAVANLEKAGASAREALEAASRSDDPEVVWQANRLLNILQEGSGGRRRPDADPEIPRRRPSVVRGASRRVIVSKNGMTDISEEQNGRVIVKETRDGKTEEYKADSRAEFAEKFPDIARRYGLEDGTVDPLDADVLKRIEELRKAAELARRDSQGGKDLDKLEEELRRALEESKARGGAPRGNRGTLGAEFAPVDEALRYQLDLPEGGVVIKSVEKGSRAQRLGLEANDILLTLNGNPVSTAPEIRAALQAEGPATAEVVREGEHQTLREK